MAYNSTDEADDPAIYVDRLAAASVSEHGALKAILREARIALSEEGWREMIRAFAERVDDPASPLFRPLTCWSEDKGEHAVDRFFGEVLVELSADAEAIVGLLAAALDGREIAEHWNFLNAFERWCRAHPGRAKAGVDLIMSDAGPAAMLAPALRAGMTDEGEWHRATALDLLANGDAEMASFAGQVLAGDMALPEEAADEVLNAAETRLPSLIGEDHTRLFDAALGLAMRLRPTRVAALLELASADEIEPCRRAAAQHLAIARDRPGTEVARAMLEFVMRGDTKNSLAVDLLDDALRRWLPYENPPGPFLDTLIALLSRDDIGIDRLDSSAHALQALDPARRDSILARLLVDGGVSGVDAVAHLAHRQLENQLEPEIDFTPYALGAEDAKILIRRVTGIVSLAPKTAIAILLSMLRSGPAEARAECETLIFDPLLISFWEDGRAYLAARRDKEQDSLKATIVALIAQLDEYIAAVHEAGYISELFPPRSNRFLAALKRAADNREINKKAMEGSLLAGLFPTRLILNGDSTVYRVFDGDGVGKRAEQEMQAQEYTQQLPRLDAIDPFGFWYRRRLMINGMGT